MGVVGCNLRLGLVEMTSVVNVLSDFYQKQNGLVGFASTFSQQSSSVHV